MLIFMEGGKPEDLEKNPCGKGENQHLNSQVPELRIEPMTHWDHSSETSILPQCHTCISHLNNFFQGIEPVHGFQNNNPSSIYFEANRQLDFFKFVFITAGNLPNSQLFSYFVLELI
jgi:hypothetical protein